MIHTDTNQEPNNGHRISCPKCWDIGCPDTDGTICMKCRYENLKLMASLDKLVNGPENPRWH